MIYIYTKSLSHFKNRLPGFVIGIFFRLKGTFFSLKVGIINFTWETIFFPFIFKVCLLDLSIKHANPNKIAPDFFINLTHSKLDFPVVITSSIIKTLDFFLNHI